MEQKKCPICGSPVIGDYRYNKIVCGNCGSDLSVFHTLHNKNKRNKVSTLCTVASCVVLVFLTYFFTHKIGQRHNNQAIAEKIEEIERLKTDIVFLSAQKDAPKEVSTTQPAQDSIFVYTIRKGDSFCVISQRFYGTEKYYKEIAEDNALDIDNPLEIGKQIIIKTR